MTEIHLSQPVEAAARCYYDRHIKVLRSFDKGGRPRPAVDFADLPTPSKFAFRRLVTPLVFAAHRDIARQSWDHCADQLHASSHLMNSDELKDANPYADQEN